ncbi:MAG: hypothetical protein K9K38_16575 [Rhodoferax sp.]|nr:hypothetical protein [Rhodoferax sp.]
MAVAAAWCRCSTWCRYGHGGRCRVVSVQAVVSVLDLVSLRPWRSL